MTTRLEETRRKVLDEFHAKTGQSARFDRQARAWLPGGDTRTTVYYAPYPVYMERGEGCRLYDYDGNVYLDLLNNYTSLIHGHAHPVVTAAARAAMEKGTIFGAPAEIQIIHAGHLCRRLPSLDLVRYCNSGTEATLFALRAARAFTGRDVIVKIDGGYHGSHDTAEVNLTPDLKTQGLPRPQVEWGVPACTMYGVLIAPFNDLPAMEKLVSEHQDQVAAVIVEPIMGAGGLLNPAPGYLSGLRELTEHFGVLLVFDEVITFRLHWGGMQAREKVVPDLTSLGKIIGGGLPVGAFGGREDIMAVFDPTRPRFVGHGGTFNGNNVTLAAGLATLALYDQAAVDRLNGLGDRLRLGFAQALESVGLLGRLTGQGSLMALHWGEAVPQNARQSVAGARSNVELYRLLHLCLVNRGIHAAPRGMYVLSTAITEAEVDRAVESFQESLAVLKPVIEESWPHLLMD